MDGSSSSATLLRPRLRLLRRSPSPRAPDPDAETTPHTVPPAARTHFSAAHDEDEFPTPRMHPRPIHDPAPPSFPALAAATPAPADTPAARLRALLAREPRSPRDTTPAPPRPPPSEADSAVDSARFGSSTSSVTRESLKDIFSHALREPGDTPQKGRPRRNSFDGSSMEITPVVDRDRARHRAARRSLSDEESEKPKSNRRHDPSFRSSTAVTFDSLRARLVSSQSQLMDQNLPETYTSLASTSTSASQHHLWAPPSHVVSVHAAPPVNNITPYPSFSMSSQPAFQSNLLEHDSEMQRAMGDVPNSENEASTSALNVAQPAVLSSDSHPPSLRGKNNSKLGPGHTNYELDPSTSSLTNGRTEINDEGPIDQHSQGEERKHQREREWKRPKSPPRSSTPEVHRTHSQEFHRRLSQEFRSPSHTKSLSHESVASRLQRRGSLASLRSFDGDHSSRPSSIGSQADYRDRISELEQERNHEREREWNKRHPPSRPSSSLSTSSNQSFTHSHSHPPRSPSATAYLAPTHASLRRSSSRTSLRSDSPSSLASSHDSLKERELEGKKEVTHERERNWNSPRPHWSLSKSPSTSHLKTRIKDNNTPHSSLSPTQIGNSNGHRGTGRLSTKPQSVLPNADPSTTSPALMHKPDDRSGLSLDESAVGAIHAVQSNGHSPAPGVASKFGWNFSRSPLPPLELDDSSDRRKSTSSPTPGSRLPSKVSEAAVSSQIPVRPRMKGFPSVSHATSDMSLTHVVDDVSSFQRDYRDGQTKVAEPRIPRESLVDKNSWGQGNVILASDEESPTDFPPHSTTPKGNPPDPIQEEIETDAETEVLSSPSPQDSPRLGTPAPVPNGVFPQKARELPHYQIPIPSSKEPAVSATPPDTPPFVNTGAQLATSEVSSSFALVTPPRQISFGSSILDFRTPSPPHDLPDLPGPPSSSDDDVLGGTPVRDRRTDVNPNFTLTKTPKPPGAWTATPLPPKLNHRPPSPSTSFPLDSTPPASTSTPLPRANSLPHARADTSTDNPGEDGLLTPVGTLSRARSLPLRTPAPPGAWVATPGQSSLPNNGVDQSQYGSLGRRKGLLKVRFDVTESEASATEGYSNSPISAIRLSNPELPLSKMGADRGTDTDNETVVNQVAQPLSISTPPLRPATPERPTTSISRENLPSPRSLRKSPAVRLVDAFGRERLDEPLLDLRNERSDVEGKTAASPSTPRRSLVRIVDAMGQEVGDTMKTLEPSSDRENMSIDADVSVVSDDTPVGHAEALVRMRKILRDLAESLSDTERSEDLELNSSHLEQLEEVSKAARLARNQLAHNLHPETAKHHDLHHKDRSPAWTRGLPLATKKSWNTTIIYCGVIIQLLLFLAMWRFAHAEAHRLFYTIYYDPLYPDLTPIQESSCFGGALSTSRPWSIFDSYETLRREGWWSVRKEILRAMEHVGDQAWDWWGEHAHFEKPT